MIHGDGASQRILQDLDMSSEDYLLAISRIEEVNLVASKSGSNAPHCIILPQKSGKSLALMLQKCWLRRPP